MVGWTRTTGCAHRHPEVIEADAAVEGVHRGEGVSSPSQTDAVERETGKEKENKQGSREERTQPPPRSPPQSHWPDAITCR